MSVNASLRMKFLDKENGANTFFFLKTREISHPGCKRSKSSHLFEFLNIQRQDDKWMAGNNSEDKNKKE